MKKKKYDFAGWVTKNDIECADGVIIKQNAFKHNDGETVPLVWNHNYDSPNNILGHMVLKHMDKGVYGYGYFNDTEEGQNAKKLVQHGDISSLSMGARKVKRSGVNVVHGLIYEVSLVLAGANKGAKIESVLSHGADGEEEAVIWTGTLIHSGDDIVDDEDVEEVDEIDKDDEKKDDKIQHNADTTIQDVIETMNDQQKEAVYALLGAVADFGSEQIDDEKGDDETMKQNVFDKAKNNGEEMLKHSVITAVKSAISGKGTLKDALASIEVTGENGEVLQHGINSIEMLFPEAFHSTNGNAPIMYKDPNTAYKEILNAVHKSPFSRVRTLVADLTQEEARAKGYVKGNMKKEEFFSLIKRTTTPTTVYKKQKLDRDDIIDITDFDVVSFMNAEMRIMLEEEIARAILVGDGRDIDNEDKINEQNIRPVISDHEFFTIKKNFTSAAVFVETVIKAMAEYRGSGLPTMYIDPTVLADVKLLKGTDGRYLFGDIPSDQAIAARLGMKNIVPTSFMIGKGALVVNLSDYSLGSTKGGQLTNFNDFDIDFNQYKYLIETRLSGALTLPKSAIHFAQGSTPGTGADDTKGGMTWGERQEDKEVTEG